MPSTIEWMMEKKKTGIGRIIWRVSSRVNKRECFSAVGASSCMKSKKIRVRAALFFSISQKWLPDNNQFQFSIISSIRLLTGRSTQHQTYSLILHDILFGDQKKKITKSATLILRYHIIWMSHECAAFRFCFVQFSPMSCKIFCDLICDCHRNNRQNWLFSIDWVADVIYVRFFFSSSLSLYLTLFFLCNSIKRETSTSWVISMRKLIPESNDETIEIFCFLSPCSGEFKVKWVLCR